MIKTGFRGVTMVNPTPSKIARVEGVKAIAVCILGYLRAAEPEFIPDEGASELCGHPIKPTDDVGWMQRTFPLSDLRRFTGRENYERDDALLLQALGALVRAGQVRVTAMKIRREDKTGDCFFQVILGAAIREGFFPNGSPMLGPPRWFEKDADLFPGSVIPQPFKVFTELLAAKEAALSKRFGRIDLELESRLHREDNMDEVRLKKAIDKIAANIEDKK